LGFSITFSHDFLLHNSIPLQFIQNLNLFNEFGDAPPLQAQGEDFDEILSFGEQLLQKKEVNNSFSFEAQGALLKLLLIKCNHLCDIDNSSAAQDQGNNLFMRYKDLINVNYHHWHNVSQYSSALHVSADYLNRISKTLSGKTAKEHIQGRIILAAKRMIYFSDLSHKEMAFELGFSEPSNFSSFFKKCTNYSPSEFKKKAQVGNA